MPSSAEKSHKGVQQQARHTKHATPGRRALAPARRANRPTVRKQSKTKLWGIPLWQVARGPNPANGERVGHARAIFAFGDIADGVVAVGGISRGLISIGGISLGVCSLGGIAVGLLGALGGVALAPAALGGVAVGALAIGGSGRDIHGRVRARHDSILGDLCAHLPRFVRNFSGLQLHAVPHHQDSSR